MSKKRKMTRVIAWTLINVFIINILLCVNSVNVNAASTKTQVNFINVTKEGTVADKGDATLIDCNGAYILVDGGRNEAYDQLYKYLNKYCKRTEGKIVFEYVVIRHNHVDHYQGINKILKDTTNFKVKNVYKTDIAPADSVEKACKDAKANSGTKIVNLNVGVLKKINLNGTVIKFYGPSRSYSKMGQIYTNMSDTSKQNNLSLTVKVEASGLTCLILGDQSLDGLKESKKVYEGIFKTSGSYKVCKFGHHGVRNTKLENDQVSNDIKEEKDFFKNNYNANLYYLSTSRDKVHIDDKLSTLEGLPRRIRKNYVYFKKNLTGDVSTAIAAYQGNLEVCSNGGKVVTNRSTSTGGAMY